MAVMLPTSRRAPADVQPVLPISPRSAASSTCDEGSEREGRTITFTDEDGRDVTTPVTGGA